MSKQKKLDAKKRRKAGIRHQRDKEKRKRKLENRFQKETSIESLFTDILHIL